MNVDVKPPPAPAPAAAAGDPDLDAATDYVRELQRDGRLLLRHVARRTDRALAAGPSTAAGAGGGSTLQVLTAAPAGVVRDRAQLEALVAAVDSLSRQAAPATASTIRLTSAYLRLATEGGEPPAGVLQRVRRVRAIIVGIMAVALAAMLSALVLLAHVDDGRRAVQQLQQVRAELKSAYAELGALPPAAWVTQSAPGAPPLREVGGGGGGAEPLPACPLVADPPTAAAPWRGRPEDGPPHWRAPAPTQDGARAQALCSQVWEASMREELTFLRLQDWNCRNHRLFELGFLTGGCGAAPGTPPPLKGLLTGRDWERTEMRTGAVISMWTGFVLPMLLGCIGGCAYVLRRLDQKLSDSTLEVRDGWHAALRVLLATMLGGLLGAVWSGDQQVHLGGYALSLAAAAFFVGFALEAVFTVIEAMVEGVAGKLRAPAPAATIVMAGPVSATPTAPGAAPYAAGGVPAAAPAVGLPVAPASVAGREPGPNTRETERR